jgi:hypothetical protein
LDLLAHGLPDYSLLKAEVAEVGPQQLLAVIEANLFQFLSKGFFIQTNY